MKLQKCLAKATSATQQGYTLKATMTRNIPTVNKNSKKTIQIQGITNRRFNHVQWTRRHCHSPICPRDQQAAAAVIWDQSERRAEASMVASKNSIQGDRSTREMDGTGLLEDITNETKTASFPYRTSTRWQYLAHPSSEVLKHWRWQRRKSQHQAQGNRR